MTEPLVGLTRTPTHMYSWNGGPLVPGVTTVKDMYPKFLLNWKGRVTAEAALANLDGIRTHRIHRLPEPDCAFCMAMGRKWLGPDDAAVRWLNRQSELARDKTADLGTRVHAIADALAHRKRVEVAEDEASRVNAYLKWLRDKKPKIKAVEFMVYSERHQYGGTGDILYELDGELHLDDLKTGAGVYAETALQLVGLERADWIGKPGDPRKYRVPQPTKHGVLHVTPDGVVEVPFEITDAEWQAFLACRALWQWKQDREGSVKGRAA